jgi:acyl-CoA thioesterase I
VPFPDLRVAFVGDSITAGVGDATALGWVGRVVAAARGDGIDLTGYNLGVRRETGPQVQARWLGEAQPRLRLGDGFGVVLAVGVNDTTEDGGERRVPERETLAAVQRVAEQADAAGWRLLVVGPTPVDDDEQNRRITGLSAAMGVRCADLGAPFLELSAHLQDDEWRRNVASRDGAHPTAAGYERLAALIGPAFRTWLHTLVA